MRAPWTLLAPVRPPGGPLKILLPLEAGPFSRQGGLLGAPKIVLPSERGRLLGPRGSKTNPRPAIGRSRVAKIGQRPPQDNPRRCPRRPSWVPNPSWSVVFLKTLIFTKSLQNHYNKKTTKLFGLQDWAQDRPKTVPRRVQEGQKTVLISILGFVV